MHEFINVGCGVQFPAPSVGHCHSSAVMARVGVTGGAARWLGPEASLAKSQGCKPRLIKNVEMRKCPVLHRNVNNNSAIKYYR